MKIRAQTKKVKGKLRWYLAESYRNNAGKPRTRWLIYLGEPPNPSQKEFIARWNKNPGMDVFYRLFGIDYVKRSIRISRKNRKWQRDQRIPRLKRRRELYAAHKAGLPMLRRNDPLAELDYLLWKHKQQSHEANSYFEQARQRHGPIETGPEELKEIFRSILKPIVEMDSRLTKMLAVLSGSGDVGAVQPAPHPPHGQNDEEPGSQIEPVAKMLKVLDEREATIIRGRYGMEDGTIKTLSELGRKFGVTRERVRQIQNLALRKLRCG